MDARQGAGESGRRWGARPPALSAQKLFEREPPRSLEAEMSLLGSMILEPRVVGDVISFVKGAEDFYKEAHGHIYRAVVEIYDTRNSGDLVQITDLLKQRGVFEQVGGGSYLVELASAVPTATNAKHYAKIVAEKAKLRRLIDAAGQILHEAYHTGDLGPDGAREVIDRAETAVFEIAQETDSADPQALGELLEAEMRRIEADDFEGGGYRGLPTGYGDLDEMLRGLQPGELVIIAARPSMGKTALALNLAEQVAVGGVPVPGAAPTRHHPVAVFSLEMSRNAIAQRMLSARAGISGQMLRGGHKIPDQDFRRLLEAADDLRQAPIYVDDTPNLTVLQLRARARRMVSMYGIRCVMIDYLQLMTAPGAARESRQVEVSAISRGVKALARELNIPVICLSQLNRASEQREGNRPRMADLRESGSIEQDADVIVLLHREDYYHTQDPDWRLDNPDKVGLAELIVAKQRNGPTGVVKLRWDDRTTRFRAFEPHAAAPGGFVEAAPFDAPPRARGTPGDVPNAFRRATFAPGGQGGPVEGHRDGGGPDRDDDAGEDLGIPT